MSTQEIKMREIQAIKENKAIKGNMIKIIIMLIVSVLALISSVKAQVEVNSNPVLDRQLFDLINQYRVNMGVRPVEERNYEQACLNARRNFVIDGKSITSKVQGEYLRSDGKIIKMYNLYTILKELPSDFLLSDKWTAVAIYYKGDKVYPSFARS